MRQAHKMEAVGQLAGGVAHDFKNLLTVILGYSEIALASMSKHDALRQPIEEIHNAGERAKSLTQQLLAFSRMQVLQMRTLSLSQVVSEMEGMLRSLIREDIVLATSLACPVDSIRGDPTQIQQIIMNLTVNAVDAMPKGGKLTITASNVVLDENYAEAHPSVRPGPHVMLSVADTGHGMDAETLGRIFEPFFTTKERSKGTGLGLSTVYGIVKQHGGSIWAYSEVGLGTSFKVYFPTTVRDPDPIGSRPRDREARHGTETILVVEDDEVVRRLTRRMLASHGYNVLVAETPEQAVELGQQRSVPIHLLLTDVIMPHMNGRTLYHEILRSHPGVKVLFMSGYPAEVIANHGVLENGVHFVEKPFSADVLTQQVRETLAT